MTQNKQQYKEVTIYWKWDSAISFSPLSHYRKKNKDDEWEGELKGYKIKVTVTNDTFKNKDYIYLEQEELLNLILVLSNKVKEAKSIRNSTTSNTEKSFTIKKMPSWDILINFDVKWKDKLNFRISNLHKIVLYKMVMEVLLKEIPRTTNITMNKIELMDYIDLLIEWNTTISKNVDSDEDKNSNNWYYLSFINTFNNKKYTNKIKVSEKFYNYLEKNGIQSIDSNLLISKIKENTIEDENKFLNSSNISTLKCLK